MYHETTVTYTEDAINYIKDKRRHALALFLCVKLSYYSYTIWIVDFM